MSCGVGCRRSSGPASLWPWNRLAATVLIRPLAWDFPYAAGGALEKNKTKKKRKVAGYKINIQKSVAFLYTNKEILEKEYKNIIPFKVTPPKKIKYLGINLTKEVKDLYAENHKTLIKEEFLLWCSGNDSN